jgi:VWFA-related protein
MARSTRGSSLAGLWFVALAAGAGGGQSPAAPGPEGPTQLPPTFRSAVDLIAVDVQVVDDTGTPVATLTPADFEVSISGGRRRVVSAEFVRSTPVDGTPFAAGDLSRPASNNQPVAGPTSPGRVYILSFDVGSLTVGDSRVLVGSALTFIDRLRPVDEVGLHTYPTGPRKDPTTDHASVRQLVRAVVGSRTNSQGFESRFHLSPSEVIDITAESVRASPFVSRGLTARGTPVLEDAVVFGAETDTLRLVQQRECGTTETRCGEEVRAEAMSLAQRLEAHAIGGINGIRGLTRLLTAYSGRKTVVMFSAGMPTSDRPGGRPDLLSLSRALGRDAAATNTAIYTIYVDGSELRHLSAGGGRATNSAGTGSRDRAVESLVLEEFADASGGALLRMTTGSGEYALERVLRETSAHYLLGVEPQRSDSDGTLRRLDVKVKRPRVTVRSREWVSVPIDKKRK